MDTRLPIKIQENINDLGSLARHIVRGSKSSEAKLDHALCGQLVEAVEHLTTSGQPSLDKVKLKEIKNICRTSDAYVDQLFHLVMTQLRKDHAEIRLSAFQIIQDIFTRSHHFRELLVAEFQDFLELTTETCLEMPLPPPKAAATLLREQTLKAVQNWYVKFGPSYKKLVLGYKYLTNVKKVKFDDIQAISVAQQQREERRTKKLQISLQESLNEMQGSIPDMLQSLTELENCFQLLLPSPKHFDHNVDEDTDEKSSAESSTKSETALLQMNADTSQDGACDGQDSSVASTSRGGISSFLQQHGLTSWTYNINIEVNQGCFTVEETDDNTDILQIIDDSRRLLMNTYLPKIVKWMEILSKTGKEEDKLKRCIDIKQNIQTSLDKLKTLNIKRRPLKKKDNDEDDEDEDDDFEVVPEKEGYEPHIPDHLRAEYGLDPLTQEEWCIAENKREDLIDPTSRAAALDAVKKRLAVLSKSKNIRAKMENTQEEKHAPSKQHNSRRERELELAPSVPFDMDLYHWEHLDSLEAPTIQRHDGGHRFWKPTDNEEMLVIEKKKASLKWRNINFSGKFEPVKWSCRSPLPNGKLCERRDRFKCPFHGNIIARDEKGQPSDPAYVDHQQSHIQPGEGSKEVIDRELQKDIEMATGVDLGSSSGGNRKGSKGKGKKRKYPNLTDIKKSNTSKKRLEKKVFNPSAMKRIAQAMTDLQQKRHNDKFANQFNYAIN